jgi:hypothetical protein
MLRRSLCCFSWSGETTTLQPWPFELVQATDAFRNTAASVQVAGILLKGSCRAIPFKTFRCDVEAVVVLLFVTGETTPLFNHGRSSYGAKPPTLSVLQASVQVAAGILLKRILQEPYHSRPFVVMLRRSLCCFREVRRNYTTLQPWPFELRCKPPTLSSTVSFGSGSWYTTERILQEYHSRPFVVMLRRSLCCFS